MNIAQIEINLSKLVENFSEESFIYDLLLAYGTPKATVSLLKKGKRNLSKRDDQIILKKKLFFQEVTDQDLHSIIDGLKNDNATHRHDPRFIIVTNYKTLLAVDTKTDDTLDIPILDITKHPFFFAPWAKIEKTNHANENPADVKAAEKMAKLYDEISQTNNLDSAEVRHGLNVFLSRLLFCFFAEDTGIFKVNAFTNAIDSHTQADGSDVNVYINRLFEVLNTEKRTNYPEYIIDFPYVNGGLFKEQCFAPVFTRKARRLLIECGKLDWKDINPDIFGSMFQAVVHIDQRSNMGMHYTSVPNIMKVIEPLFLNNLRYEFEKHHDNQAKLEQLLIRLEHLRIFDPACGSGNFLIIAYKEIRTLEMQIFQRIQEITDSPTLPFSRIELSQFYGIELDDFAHEVAILSLWLAEHQMNVAFKAVFGQANPTLPLREGGNIVCDNATRRDWEDVCPKDKDAEIYILGNPPYQGARKQSETQKSDLMHVFNAHEDYKDADYVSCWLIKGANYIEGINGQFAFVTTNSICQGEQVPYIWRRVFDKNLELGFAHTSFPWSNNAKNNAGVICIIVGVRSVSPKPKRIIKDGMVRIVNNISPYLIDSRNVFVEVRKRHLNSQMPKMVMGNMARDGGNLILSTQEKIKLLSDHPNSRPFLRKLYGSQEFIKGTERWCLWIEDDNLRAALSIPEIVNRIDDVRAFRQASKAKTTNQYASIPHKFAQRCHQDTQAIIIPSVSTEKRIYQPIGFLAADEIVTNLAFVIYYAEPYIFALLSAKFQAIWLRAISGRLGNGLRYSVSLTYNTFPIPKLTARQKETLTQHTYNLLEEREKHPEKTMAQLYDPDKMPDGLREAHHDLDIAVERCYRSKPFTSDEERLEYLFKLYEEMIEKEKQGGLL